jgi:Uncharacterized protein conserved in bacteria
MKTGGQNFFSFDETFVEDLKSKWRALIGRFSSDIETIDAVGKFLIDKYSEPHRFYHNAVHVGALLVLADDFGEKFADSVCVELAIWFHDAVYDAQKSDNEIESAKLAADCLKRLFVPEEKIRKIEKMILATERHDATETDSDGKLFLDLDLSVLGASEEIYREYARAIRREYAHVPDLPYRRGRKNVLENFLRREFIYFTDEMRQRFEARARFNIENEIKELS